MTTVDYSKPLSTLLREGTHEVHHHIENSSGVKRMLNGELSKEEYAQYLMMLWYVYDALERALERHASHPSLEPTSNPALLERAPSLSSDISYLLQTDDWQAHPVHKKLTASKGGQLNAYVDEINALASQSDPSGLLGHSYVRYLGDLSGGQTIRHTVAKAYGLDEAVGSGISFYAFKELRSSKPASQGEMRRIKDWFRAGLNAAGERGIEVKTAAIEQASKAFIFNAGLFELLEENAKEEELRRVLSQPAEKQQMALRDKEYPISQVVAVVAAVCLAHFILVVGGFTGSAGYEKWLGVEQWLKSVWQNTKD